MGQTVQVAEKDQRIVYFAVVTRKSVPEEKLCRIQKSKRPTGGGRETRAAGPSTDHVLLIYLRAGKEGCKSVEKRVTRSIKPVELGIEVLGKRPTHSGRLLVRLNSHKDAAILEKAVKEAEGLKNTVQCTVPKLRRPRIIIFDVPRDIEGSEVIAAAAKQAGVEAD